METHKTIDVSLNEAKEWYNSGNEKLKELALKCFPLRKLNAHNFENIKTFEDAVNELGKDIDHANFIVNILKHQSKASAAMYKLNIVRKALNLGQDLHLTKNPEDSQIYYPYNLFVTENSIYYERDYNAALNILDEGLRIIGSSTTEFTLVDYPTMDGRLSNEALKSSGRLKQEVNNEQV